MFHLNHNHDRGYFNWSELRLLCRSLGFQPDMIYTNLPAEVDKTEDGMFIKDILRIINLKYLDQGVDKTFNAHTADWNLCVFKKAFVLLDHRILTYEELHDIRVAFCAYEHQDLKGMEIHENTMMRCLKMCGRTIAPLKMHHRIKHMSQLFDEDGRIQLYEFLDLILWTELYDTHSPHKAVITNAMSKNSSVYQVEDFQHIIQHYDQRLAKHLDELYLNEEWTFGKEEFSKQKLPNELPVHRDFRLNNMKKAKSSYGTLKSHVNKSQQTAHITSTGHIRPRPLTAPNLEKYDQSEKSSIYTALSQHKVTVADMVRDYIHTPHRMVRTASSKKKGANMGTQSRSRKDATQLGYDSIEPAVTSKEKCEQEHELQDLKFHIATLNNRYDQKLKRDIEERLPKYVPQPKVEVADEVQEEEVVKKKPKPINPALLPESINRLAYAPYRPFPNPNHALKCDARFRGWHKVKTTRGPHYILTKAAFSDNPNARHQHKIYEDNCNTVRNIKGDCVVRKTFSSDVTQETVRPGKAPIQSPVQSTKTPQGSTKTDKATKAATKVQIVCDAPLSGTSSPVFIEESESRKPSPGHISRSAGASSDRTYSFQDFKLYTEEYEKPAINEKLNADQITTHETAADTRDTREKASSARKFGDSNRRRYSQFTGDAIAREIAGQVEDKMASKQHAASQLNKKINKLNKFAERRNLSGFVRKRLIDSATGLSTTLSAS